MVSLRLESQGDVRFVDGPKPLLLLHPTASCESNGARGSQLHVHKN